MKASSAIQARDSRSAAAAALAIAKVARPTGARLYQTQPPPSPARTLDLEGEQREVVALGLLLAEPVEPRAQRLDAAHRAEPAGRPRGLEQAIHAELLA